MDFSALESLSARLNETSDSINKSVAQVEKRLAKLRLGVPTWIKIQDNNGPNEPPDVTYFGYSKDDGNWHLGFSREYWDGPEHNEYIPFAQASRELRLKGLKELPQLLKQMEKDALKAIEEVDNVRKFVEREFPEK
jgi:hypothetical protein